MSPRLVAGRTSATSVYIVRPCSTAKILIATMRMLLDTTLETAVYLTGKLTQ